MYRRLLVIFSKVLIKLLRLMGKNGSALPGLILEKIYPNFLDKTLKTSEKKIILVTGTNGKTTTTQMLVAGLRGAGFKVVTNSTGSNMTRGLIAALIEDMTYFGSLRPTDWFVFEMDEAYAPIFTTKLSPKLLVGLNVLRDQLDRYGEIDKTAELIKLAASKSDIFVFNGMDRLLVRVSKNISSGGTTKMVSFGVARSLESSVINEQTAHGEKVDQIECDFTLLSSRALKDQQDVVIEGANKKFNLSIPMLGFHNGINVTAVIATIIQLTQSDPRILKAQESISGMPTPFGRGEKLQIKNKNITVALVKNPSGFISNLETFVKQSGPDVVIFAINDKFADGRDVSWLWDVKFKDVLPKNSEVIVTGIRRFDMALRLKQDGIDSRVLDNVKGAIDQIFKQNKVNVVIIPTYTALFEVRNALSRHGKVPRIW